MFFESTKHRFKITLYANLNLAFYLFLNHTFYALREFLFVLIIFIVEMINELHSYSRIKNHIPHHRTDKIAEPTNSTKLHDPIKRDSDDLRMVHLIGNTPPSQDTTVFSPPSKHCNPLWTTTLLTNVAYLP